MAKISQERLHEFMNKEKRSFSSDIKITVTLSDKKSWELYESFVSVVDAGDVFAISGINNLNKDCLDIVSEESLRNHSIQLTVGVAFICAGCKEGDHYISANIKTADDYTYFIDNVVEYQGKYYMVTVIEELPYSLEY